MGNEKEAGWMEEILRLGDNKTYLPNLVRQVTEAGIIPFVGAGLSAPYNLPQWAPLIEELAPSEAIRAQVKQMLAANEYEAAAQLLIDIKGPFQFQELFQSKFSISIDLTKRTAMSCLAQLPRGPMITTNFDHVLESVLEAEGCPVQVIVGHKPALTSEVFQYNTDAVLKIHGDFQDPASRILTAKSYDAAYTNWLRILLKNVATRCLLFLGCSLKTDRPLQVLAELVQEGHVQTHHYAFLSLPPDDTECHERAHWLAQKHRILPIWYPPGRHDAIEPLLTHIASGVTSVQRRRRAAVRRPRYGDIPSSRFTLFGRHPEELMKAIEGSPTVVVEGSRGVGKTAFALQALRMFMDRDTFGALAWITAATRKDHLQLKDVLDCISLTIDFPFTPQTKPEEREALLGNQLEKLGIRCLLLLDNFETVTDPAIHGYIFDPARRPRNLKVLITSTGRVLREGVQPFPLDELKEADAAAMFRERLTRDGLEQESDADVAQLYQVVGGNPLAIEWIVGQLRAGARLSRQLALLEKGRAEILPRVFAQSWQQLDEAQRSLLMAFSIFVRPALESTLQAATGLEEEVFQNSLDAASRLYLVKRLRMHESAESVLVGSRYFVHPFTRDYLEGQRAAPQTSALLERTATFYQAYVRERGGTSDKEEFQAIRELNGERENILGVLAGCLAQGYDAAAIALAQAIARWLFIESHWDDLAKYGALVVARARDTGNFHAAGRIQNEVGRTYAYRSDYGAATQAFDQAQKWAATDPPDAWALAYIQHHRAEALMRQKKYAEAEELLIQSLAGFTALESVRDAIGVRYRMGMLALEMGRLERAQELADRGIEDTLITRWTRLEGFNRRLRGDIAARRQEIAEARHQYERAQALVPKTDMRIQALLELSLAQLDFQEQRMDEARRRAETAMGHFEKLRMPREADQARRLAAGLAP